jgi:hypothetical protein
MFVAECPEAGGAHAAIPGLVVFADSKRPRLMATDTIKMVWNNAKAVAEVNSTAPRQRESRRLRWINGFGESQNLIACGSMYPALRSRHRINR